MTHRQHNEINRRMWAVEKENEALRTQVREHSELLRAMEERLNSAELMKRMADAGELEFLDATEEAKP